MNEVFSRRKTILAFAGVTIAIILLFTGILMTIPANAAVYASTEETTNVLKVFVGDIINAPDDYVQQRSDFIGSLDDADAGEIMKAVIGLDDYYTVEDVTAWAEKYDITVNRVYMWPAGETGRLSLYVETGNIWDGIKAYMQQVEESGMLQVDEEYAKDYERFLNGEYGVFAVTVAAPAETLKALNSESDCVSYVDVMYNEGAEMYAASAGKAVHYIELPAKPDGAL